MMDIKRFWLFNINRTWIFKLAKFIYNIFKIIASSLKFFAHFSYQYI